MTIEKRLSAHAATAVSMRAAVNRADEIAMALNKLSGGVIFDHEREALIKSIASNYSYLGELLRGEFDDG